ncbi:MAG: hypothetical protein KAX05_06045 [Bacteroidales bacterium]|nr:hypothetical protein [Bacteroidales bacterium]
MKLTEYFDKFLKDTVNLNQSRLDKLQEKEKIIRNFIKDSDIFKDLYKNMVEQGSYAQKTIIKPAKNNQEFDADFLLVLKENDEWEAKDYVNELYNIFKNNGNYENIVRRKKRCVVIDYSGDFHIDIVPCIEKNSNYYVCNRNSNNFEKDNPIAYKDWLMQKHKTANYHLVKSIRLFKYLRNIKTDFSIKSILLNTLLGNRIKTLENTSDFSDIPTTFYTLFDRLNEYLQNNKTMPVILNPVLSEEDLTDRNWDDDKYKNFREKISMYFEKVKDAYKETNKDESIKKWQKVFGDEFPSEIKNDNNKSANKNLSALGALAGSNKLWGY